MTNGGGKDIVDKPLMQYPQVKELLLIPNGVRNSKKSAFYCKPEKADSREDCSLSLYGSKILLEFAVLTGVSLPPVIDPKCIVNVRNKLAKS